MIIYLAAAAVLLFAAGVVWSVVNAVRAHPGRRARAFVILALALSVLIFVAPRACRGFVAGFNAAQNYRNSHPRTR